MTNENGKRLADRWQMVVAAEDIYQNEVLRQLAIKTMEVFPTAVNALIVEEASDDGTLQGEVESVTDGEGKFLMGPEVDWTDWPDGWDDVQTLASSLRHTTQARNWFTFGKVVPTSRRHMADPILVDLEAAASQKVT